MINRLENKSPELVVALRMFQEIYPLQPENADEIFENAANGLNVEVLSFPEDCLFNYYIGLHSSQLGHCQRHYE
jgi:hypothetical protein